MPGVPVGPPPPPGMNPMNPMSPMGMPPVGPPPGKQTNTALVIVIVVLILAAIGGGIYALSSGDDNKDGAGTQAGGNLPGSGTTLPGSATTDVSLPDITLPESGTDLTVPDVSLPGSSGGDLGSSEAGPPDSPPTGGSYDDLANQCYQGDMGACDNLFIQAPLGSPEGNYGDTCGGRFDVSQGFCATALPDPVLPS
jgi:hypothetical protein